MNVGGQDGTRASGQRFIGSRMAKALTEEVTERKRMAVLKSMMNMFVMME